jgi:N6-L-threonylcarbamoyladenine synthase
MFPAPLILAIESSCDDTSIAVLRGKTVLSNVVASQLIHEDFGGVVPELASRAHMQNILPVYQKALKIANVQAADLNAIAFTNGPGLMGALLVGVSFAKSLAIALNLPIIHVNHIHAHVLAHLIEGENIINPNFPFLCLTVSGGHTQIVEVNSAKDLNIIGQTIDDAAGEAFDKIAKLLNLPYPGGPVLDKLAQSGDVHKFKFSDPRNGLFDFTFSGLKTSVLYFLQKEIAKNTNFISENLNDICASVQFTIVDALIKQLLKAAKNTKIKNLAIAGGVSANSELRKQMNNLKSLGFNTFIPSFQFCTDNAAMIGIVGYFKFMENDFCDLDILPQAKF